MTKKKKKTLDILEPYKKWAQLGLVFQNQFKINADQAAKIIEKHIFEIIGPRICGTIQ